MAQLTINGELRNTSDRIACRLVREAINGKGELTEAQITHELKAAGIEFKTRLRSALHEGRELGCISRTERGKWKAV